MKLMRGVIVKDEKKSFKPTIILNKSGSDDFLDFYDSSDLKEVLRVLNKKNK